MHLILQKSSQPTLQLNFLYKRNSRARLLCTWKISIRKKVNEKFLLFNKSSYKWPYRKWFSVFKQHFKLNFQASIHKKKINLCNKKVVDFPLIIFKFSLFVINLELSSKFTSINLVLFYYTCFIHLKCIQASKKLQWPCQWSSKVAMSKKMTEYGNKLPEWNAQYNVNCSWLKISVNLLSFLSLT